MYKLIPELFPAAEKWSIAVINTERKYANKTMQNNMQRIIDIFGCRSNRSSYFF